MVIFLFVDPTLITIKPEKGFNNLLPWFLGPFAYGRNDNKYIGIVGITCHLVFLVSVGAELEYKLKNNGRFLSVYIFVVYVSNIFLYFLWAPNSPITCNSTLNI